MLKINYRVYFNMKKKRIQTFKIDEESTKFTSFQKIIGIIYFYDYTIVTLI